MVGWCHVRKWRIRRTYCCANHCRWEWHAFPPDVGRTMVGKFHTWDDAMLYAELMERKFRAKLMRSGSYGFH